MSPRLTVNSPPWNRRSRRSGYVAVGRVPIPHLIGRQRDEMVRHRLLALAMRAIGGQCPAIVVDVQRQAVLILPKVDRHRHAIADRQPQHVVFRPRPSKSHQPFDEGQAMALPIARLHLPIAGGSREPMLHVGDARSGSGEAGGGIRPLSRCSFRSFQVRPDPHGRGSAPQLVFAQPGKVRGHRSACAGCLVESRRAGIAACAMTVFVRRVVVGILVAGMLGTAGAVCVAGTSACLERASRRWGRSHRACSDRRCLSAN